MTSTTSAFQRLPAVLSANDVDIKTVEITLVKAMKPVGMCGMYV